MSLPTTNYTTAFAYSFLNHRPSFYGINGNQKAFVLPMRAIPATQDIKKNTETPSTKKSFIKKRKDNSSSKAPHNKGFVDDKPKAENRKEFTKRQNNSLRKKYSQLEEYLFGIPSRTPLEKNELDQVENTSSDIMVEANTDPPLSKVIPVKPLKYRPSPRHPLPIATDNTLRPSNPILVHQQMQKVKIPSMSKEDEIIQKSWAIFNKKRFHERMQRLSIQYHSMRDAMILLEKNFPKQFESTLLPPKANSFYGGEVVIDKEETEFTKGYFTPPEKKLPCVVPGPVRWNYDYTRPDPKLLEKNIDSRRVSRGISRLVKQIKEKKKITLTQREKYEARLAEEATAEAGNITASSVENVNLKPVAESANPKVANKKK